MITSANLLKISKASTWSRRSLNLLKRIEEIISFKRYVNSLRSWQQINKVSASWRCSYKILINQRIEKSSSTKSLKMGWSTFKTNMETSWFLKRWHISNMSIQRKFLSKWSHIFPNYHKTNLLQSLLRFALTRPQKTSKMKFARNFVTRHTFTRSFRANSETLFSKKVSKHSKTQNS
jgi:hypothetical protein